MVRPGPVGRRVRLGVGDATEVRSWELDWVGPLWPSRFVRIGFLQQQFESGLAARVRSRKSAGTPRVIPRRTTSHPFLARTVQSRNGFRLFPAKPDSGPKRAHESAIRRPRGCGPCWELIRSGDNRRGCVQSLHPPSGSPGGRQTLPARRADHEMPVTSLSR